ncbi:uncharacterized protein LOC134243828 [Saccostrea cucullata]|uniref:uncharacterized protein LOC134243828 n=1 Tax=Saccostrea cuccullata TaxID=36930 RepID=UPI002ED24A20
MNRSCKIDLEYPTSNERYTTVGLPVLDATVFIVVGFGGLSIIVALIHNALHRYFFKDQHRLDTVFDAGGRVTTSLTAVTVASQVLWPVDLVQTSVIATKSGLGTIYFYVVGLAMIIAVFPCLTLNFKTKAPGAKTYPQVVCARYGKASHILYCCIALATNLITITSMILTGKYILEAVIPGISTELSVLILVFLFGSYCYIGGLGAAFYISYFNTSLMCIALAVFSWQFLSPPDDLPEAVRNVTDIKTIYESVRCVKGPSLNAADSLLTFRSVSGFTYGVVAFFMVLALNCCDQAMWQSRIAAKPEQGVTGFLIGCFLYFSIPTSLALPTFLSYVSLSYQNGSYLLSQSDMDNGFITNIVMEKVLDTSGSYLLLMIVFMALMATGSGEVIAASSIIIYDIYKTYLGPFRKDCGPSVCPLCGVMKFSLGDKDRSYCQCIYSAECSKCVADVELCTSGRPEYQLHYQCPIHGEYRHYEDMLKEYKGWTIMWISLALIPYGIIIANLDLNLTWVFFVFECLLTPFISPLVLTFTWSKCTSKGLISGAISGLIASIAALLIVAEVVHDAGLSDFFVTTSSDYSLLGACIAGLLVSTMVTIIVSFATHTIKSKADEEKEWAKMISIDNPINSWKMLYEEEFENFEIPKDRDVTVSDMQIIFRKAKKLAFFGALVCGIVQVLLIPGIMLAFEELSADQLYSWMLFFFVALVIATTYSVVAPPVEEIIKVFTLKRKNERRPFLSKRHNDTGKFTASSRL